jgi:pimeloyl-ACP methyl ester carboxylesterase
MRTIAIALVTIIVTACGDDSPSPPLPHYDYELHQNPGVPEYGLIARGSSLAIVFAADIDMSLTGDGIVPISQQLAHAGFSVASLDLPSHHAGEEPFGLEGWRSRIEAGETEIFTNFCDDVSAVLDDLNATKVSAIGVSRGGYAVAICAARDERIQNVAMLAPVTDLTRLREFSGAALDPAIFGLGRYAPILATRTVLIRIGRTDQRVGTDAAIALARSIGAELVLDRVDGHTLKDNDSTARWVLAHH